MRTVYVPKAQARLWLADQLTPDSAVYLSNVFFRLRGPLDAAAAEAALRAVVTRHEVLRTSLLEADGELVGVVRPEDWFRLETVEAAEADLDVLLRADAATPVDAAAGLPFRARLLRLAPDDHVLCIGVHHMAADRGSLDILYNEFGLFYRRLTAASDEPEPPELAKQFRDIALAQDAWHDSPALGPAIELQRSALAGRDAFELVPDRPRPAVRTGTGALCHTFELPDATLHGLTAVARSKAASLYMVLLAATHAVLHRYTGRTDVTTGTSSATREGADAAAAIGPFFTMLALPGDTSGNPAFSDLVARVRDIALDAYEGRRIAFDTLVNELGVPRDPSRTPLFQILVDLTTPVRPPRLPGIEVAEILTPGSGAKYDLTIEFRTEPGLGISVEWDSALYEQDSVMRLMEHLRTVLNAVAADPRLRIDDIPMLGAAELDELRALAAPEREPLPRRCLHQLFEEQAARTPDAVAVCDGQSSWSYADLDARATEIARGLVALGVGPDVPVAVLLDRSADLIAALYGILKAGGAFVPVDPESPLARVGTILRRAGAPLCLIPSGDFGADPARVPEVAAEAGCRAVDLETVCAAAGRQTGLPVVRPANLCSIYFTSGSTGEPKGVASTHRGWVGQMANLQKRYRLAAGETLLFKTPLSFDDVAREIFWPLMLGARTVVLPPGLHRDPRALLEATITHRLPWLQFVPGMLALYLDEITPAHLDGLRGLRDLVSDGDRLPPATVEAFQTRLGRPLGVRLNNHWGTTEVSIDSTHHVCSEADAADEGDAVAIGTPMENHEVHLLDATLNPVPRGAVGELCIGGVGLARGYLGDPGRTARAFVPHPFRPGERLYRTGDTGRLRPDGELVFRGRRDHQVKVRGIRVELGEVEAAVKACPLVGDAVVGTWEPAPGDRRVVAYVVAAAGESTLGRPAAALRVELRDFLISSLAPHAVPGAIVVLPELPRNPSGKIDRRSLPAPDPDALSDGPFVPPATDAEQALARVWATVLGVERLGATDDFFAVGGHSLLVTRAVNRMREVFAVDVPVRLVFEHSTVRAAAARLEDMILAEVEALSEEEAEALLATVE
ncbi:amino acid adenylation domain-containing protein [Catenulispora subtropica]|uniref:Carrier domain-containing protein n=1 Tax=Catenulispora subtropica TaxID=450798 RepID=A0ABN2TEW1_9ACTN